MALHPVGSAHPSVRMVSAARRGVGPRARGLLAIDGLWGLEYALAARADVETFLWCPERATSERAQRCAHGLQSLARESYLVSTRTLARLNVPDSGGLICTVRLPDSDPAHLELGAAALILIADGIEYAGNLGSLIRTADACAADCLVLTNARARRTHPKVFTASRGTVLSTPMLEFAGVRDARDWLERAGAKVFLADPNADRSYREADYGRGRCAFVVGSEGGGISADWYGDAQAVSIPMLGDADSLNVATSAGILLYEARARKQAYPTQNCRTSTEPNSAIGWAAAASTAAERSAQSRMS